MVFNDIPRTFCDGPQTRFCSRFPQHFILSTEACADPQTSKPPRVSLGDWSRGNQYSHSIIEVFFYQQQQACADDVELLSVPEIRLSPAFMQ